MLRIPALSKYLQFENLLQAKAFRATLESYNGVLGSEIFRLNDNYYVAYYVLEDDSCPRHEAVEEGWTPIALTLSELDNLNAQ